MIESKTYILTNWHNSKESPSGIYPNLVNHFVRFCQMNLCNTAYVCGIKRIDMRNTASFLLILILNVFTLQAEGKLLLPPGDIHIYISSSEEYPVHRALDDLNRDLEKVTGHKARIHQIRSLQEVTGDHALVLLNESNTSFPLPPDCMGKTSGAESHRVYVQSGRVYLQGFDKRGLIYAIYTFSEQILNIPPLWFWASMEPETRESIELSESTDLYFPSPEVRYRAWFPNDQDLFNPWKSIKEANRQAWLETMLRLKLNTIEYGSPIFYPTSNSPARLLSEVDSIRKRGFVLAYTHTNSGRRTPSGQDHFL